MRKTTSVVPGNNPDADVLAKAFFNNGQEPGMVIFFSVDDNPFDPRIGTQLPFVTLEMSRMGGTGFRLRGFVVEPCEGKPRFGGKPDGFHKATMVYDIATRTGKINIRD